MSLFDHKPDERKPISRKTSTSLHPRKYPSDDQALLDNRYGTGSRSASRTTAANRTRSERQAITEAYERGEIKFSYESILLCHCTCSPEFHFYPHSPHTDGLAKFELEHYGKKK